EERKTVKAYNNLEFLNSPDARLLRILAEYLEPARRFRQYRIQDTIVFFGSARIKSREVATAEVEQLKAKIAELTEVAPELQARYELAKRELLMARYYEDAAEISRLLTE